MTDKGDIIWIGRAPALRDLMVLETSVLAEDLDFSKRVNIVIKFQPPIPTIPSAI